MQPKPALPVIRSVCAVLFAAIIVVYPFLFIFQGLDFTDMGFAASNYQMVFSHPESISYWGFNYWLTDVIGGLWLKGFASWGLLGLRVAAALSIVLICLFVYFLLRKHVRPWLIGLGLIAAEAVIERMYWLNYDNVSALFYVLTACLLLWGTFLHHRIRYVILALAGTAMGLTAFLRVTNAADVALLLVIPASVVLVKKKWRFAVLGLCLVLAGAFCTAYLLLLYMKSAGQYSLFIDNLQTLLNIAGGRGNTHSSGNLMANFNKDQTYALRVGGYTLLVLGAIALIRRFTNKVIGTLIVIALLAIGTALLWPHFYSRYDLVAGLTGVLYALLAVGTFLYARTNGKLSLICLTSLIVLVVVPIGSDLGIRIATYGMYLAIPIGAQVLHDVVEAWPRSSKSNGQGTLLGPVTTILSLVVVLAVGIDTGYHYTYRDTSQRPDMRYSIDHPLLRGVYTTQDRAEVVQQLLNVMPRYVHPGDELLAYEETSMLYYLTDSVPYLGSSWPMLYDPNQMTAVLKQKSATGGPWPVVVRATGATADFYWPDVDHLRLDYRHNEDRALIERFLHQHGYHSMWHNRFFEILVPANASGNGHA